MRSSANHRILCFFDVTAEEVVAPPKRSAVPICTLPWNVVPIRGLAERVCVRRSSSRECNRLDKDARLRRTMELKGRAGVCKLST